MAKAITWIVEQCNGSRPARVIVGEPSGVEAINAQATSVQVQLLEGFGLGQLAEPRKVLAEA